MALSNLAAETASVKDDMRQAGAIEACVQLLTAKVSLQEQHQMLQASRGKVLSSRQCISVVESCWYDMTQKATAASGPIIFPSPISCIILKVLTLWQMSSCLTSAVQGSTVPGHAARALWNLTSKNAANQGAAREAGAVPLLVTMLSTAPTQVSQHASPKALRPCPCLLRLRPNFLASLYGLQICVHVCSSVVCSLRIVHGQDPTAHAKMAFLSFF